MYTVLSILHGGNGMPVFYESVYDYIAKGKHQSITIDEQDIPDAFLRYIVEKVSVA